MSVGQNGQTMRAVNPCEKNRKNLLLGIVFSCVAVLSPLQCQADELWINTGGFSKHFQDNGRNETNLGLGAEYRFHEDMSVMVGYHKNSLSLRTRYAAVNYQPLNIGSVKIGASIGVMDGYPAVNKGGVFFAALPMVTYEGNRFGANFGVIPNIPSKHVEGAFVLQLKFKAF